jgi:hypothetical protein
MKFEIMKAKLCTNGYHRLWAMMYDKTNMARDRFLKSIGLDRIIKTKGNSYYICSFKSTDGNEKGYIITTNLRVIDEQKYFLAKIKHGL